MSAAPQRLHHLVVGPDEHGVTGVALHAARADGADPGDPRSVTRLGRAVGTADLPALLERLPAGERVHVHVTDRLFGAGAAPGGGPDAALAVLRAVAGRTVLSATLHDLPQESDGEPSRTRRTRCYAEVARACTRVIVSSEHERALLAECLRRSPAGTPGPSAPEAPAPAESGAGLPDEGLPGAGLPDDRFLAERVSVVPLPVDVLSALAVPRPADPTPARPRDVAVLGFVYPGKGHAEVLDALDGLPEDVGLLLLGRASDGHADLVDELRARAGAAGRRFAITGYLPDAELVRRLGEAAVPVAAHRHVSASGSIGTWLAVGRRPLAPRNAYAAEVERALPGALGLYDDLPSAIAGALADPASTWTPPGLVLTPSTAEVAERSARVLGATAQGSAR